MNKSLILVRGIPGAGKTTFAKLCQNGPVVSADDYFIVKGKYMFDKTKLGQAHKKCEDDTRMFMISGYPRIYVANTFTTEKEMGPYFKLAEKNGYTVFTIIVENRHGSSSVHNVPTSTLEMMKNRFDIKL